MSKVLRFFGPARKFLHTKKMDVNFMLFMKYKDSLEQTFSVVFHRRIGTG